MDRLPRFHAEIFVLQNIAEIRHFVTVCNERVVRPFDRLPDEAKEVARIEFERIGKAFPDWDAGSAAESATTHASEFFESVNAVRLGVTNLLVAGIFHLIEQQSPQMADCLLPKMAKPETSENPLARLKSVLRSTGVQIENLDGWGRLDELRLIAGCVKHGDGRSARDLREGSQKGSCLTLCLRD